MKTKKEYIELVREYFENTAQKYGVTKMALFGSVARNEQNEKSDLDIAYEGKADLFLRIRMKMELEKLLECKVDLIRLRQDLSGTLFNEELSKDLIYV
ncbi:nucleotidyltransferase family protein [Bacteroides salyersiae]|jgi:predicted nucleotidyltransferase|uniref:nucleotidyltransferase family protein n=1 Tax=Bacteroides salyersiae TaxID=291644 RepID=UPI001C8C0577|nr:nucleotidyltransferase domain-containing protein [Bacteroides salyersiae]